MIYITGGYKTPTPELEKNPCSFSKQNKGRVMTSIVQEMYITMYDIYRWWVQNPDSRVGKKSLFLLKTEQGTSHDFDRPGDAHCNV